MTRAAAAALIAATHELCALDSVAGDGDHGFAMAGAAKGILARLDAAPPQDLAGLFSLVSHEFAGVGGSMGALVSVAVESVGVAAAAPGDRHGPALAAALLAAARDSVSEFGGARPGDKTVVDAMDAATRAARALPPDTPMGGALRRIAAAAQAGAAATANMPAKIGRASRLGDKALGSVDAGATSFAMIMGALASSYQAGGTDT
jgi:dihydroxyacetone kinase